MTNPELSAKLLQVGELVARFGRIAAAIDAASTAYADKLAE
jgi:hypothetical protein